MDNRRLQSPRVTATTLALPEQETSRFLTGIGTLALFFFASFGFVMFLWLTKVEANISWWVWPVVGAVAAFFSPIGLLILPGMLRFGHRRQGYTGAHWIQGGSLMAAGLVVGIGLIGIMNQGGVGIRAWSMLAGEPSYPALFTIGMMGSLLFIVGAVEGVRGVFIKRPYAVQGKPIDPRSIQPGLGPVLHFGYGFFFAMASLGIVSPLLAESMGAADAAIGTAGMVIATLLFALTCMMLLMACCLLTQRDRVAGLIDPWTTPNRSRMLGAGVQLLAGFILLMTAYDPDWFLATFGGA